MSQNRFTKLNAFASHSSELISLAQYTSSFQYSSDIRGENVDIMIVDSGLDSQHYEFTDPDTNESRVQLINWSKLVDDPGISYDELRTHDFTFEGMDATIKGYFQEIIDDAVANGGFELRNSACAFDNSICYAAGMRGWQPVHLITANWQSHYHEKMIRDGLEAMINYYPMQYEYGPRFDINHGTGVSSCAAGRTVGMAPKSHIYHVAVDYNTLKGINYHHVADLFHECKKRSGNTRPTVINLSIGSKVITNKCQTDGLASESSLLFTSSISQNGFFGPIEATVPAKVSEYHKMVSEGRHVHYPSGSVGAGTDQYPITGSNAKTQIKKSNEVLDYIEETFNFTPAKMGRYSAAAIANKRFFKLPGSPNDVGISSYQTNRLISGGAILVNSAGNDHAIMSSHIDYTTMKNSIENEYLNGKVTNYRYRSASFCNITPKTVNDTFIPFDGQPQVIWTTPAFQTSDATFSQSLNVNFGRNSGSSVSFESLGLHQPYVVRYKAIYSNKGLYADWGDGTSWSNFSNGYDMYFTSSTTKDMSCDLSEITSMASFQSAGVTIVTGSTEEATLPQYAGMLYAQGDQEIDLETEVPEINTDIQTRYIDQDPKIGSFEFMGGYNLNADDLTLIDDSIHPPWSEIRTILLGAIIFNWGTEIFNGNTPPEGNFIGLLAEYRDINENIITGSIGLKRDLDINYHTWTHIPSASVDDQSTFSTTGMGIFGGIEGSANLYTYAFPYGLKSAYISGTLDSNSSFTLPTPTSSNTDNGQFNYIWHSDEPTLYNSVSSSFALQLDQQPLNDADLIHDLASDTGVRYYILKEDPILGRATEQVSIPVKSLDIHKNADNYVNNQGVICVGSSDIGHHQDPSQFNVSGSRWNIGHTHMTSSQFFYNSSSYEPYDKISRFSNRGSRIDIFAPGTNIWTAQSSVAIGVSVQTTFLDYFNTSSRYNKSPFWLASCSFENMTDSNGNTIPQLGWMTGSFTGSVIGQQQEFPLREAAYGYHRWNFVDSNQKIHPYSHYSGTSFASPLTAGLVALWKDLFPDINGKDMISLLQLTAHNGMLADPHLSNTKYKQSWNDFDLWYYGLLRNFLANQSAEDVFDVPGHILYASNSIQNNRCMQDWFLSKTGPITEREQMSNYGSDPYLSPASFDPWAKADRIYQYYTSRTSRSHIRALNGAPNLIAHWPFANMNRADVLGKFSNINFSGSIHIR